jgi:hypothetical protein
MLRKKKKSDSTKNREKLIDLNFRNIFTGIRNYILKKKRIEEMAKKRLALCAKCEFIDNTGDRCYVPGTQPCCSLCGCKLSFKTRVPEERCEAEQPRWIEE